jgi:hypothetical protein
MSWIWPILAMLAVAVWTLAVIDIVRRRHVLSGIEIVGWVVAIIVVPILGPIAYFIVRRFRTGQRE